ncbi:hypothetical protein PFTANZ_05869, partial [Plasmodium falciparum Tanzania (2000708)]
GDGEACDRTNTSNGVFAELEGPSCATPCGLYKRWIQRKGKEFEDQQKIYNEQKTKYQKQSETAKEFCGTPETTCDTAAEFLHYLASCKKDKENVKDKLDFSQPKETFKPATNCKPCSEFTVKLEKCNCREPAKGNTCTTGKITAENFKDKIDCKDVFMRVSDNSKNGFGDLSDCQKADIFKGIRKDVWKCGKICGLDVCKLENVIGNQNQNQIIIIRALFKRWVENFLKDYNEIKHKISHCINNGEGNICKRDCQNKCNCVEEWIKLKKEEWRKIKEHYLKQNEDGDNNMKSLVRNFFETLQPQTDVNKAIKPCKSLDLFQDSKECAVAGSSENGNLEKRDIVECLLNKLEEKAKNCPGKRSGSEQCTTPPNTLPDDEEPLEEEENPENMRPKICPPPEKPAQPENEGECKAAESPSEDKKEGQITPAPPGPPPPTPDEPSSTAGGEEQTNQTPALKPEEK